MNLSPKCARCATDTGNIKSDANRAISAFIRRSWILAGSGDVYGDAVGTSDIPWEGFYYSDTQDVDALENIAGVQLGARDDAGDTLRLRGKLGNDPANGYYLPFEHVLLDDLGTIHTGTGQWDYNEQDFPVAAITLQLRPGGDWDVWYDMGSSFSATERRFQVTPVPSHNHGPNPSLCDPTVPGTGDTELFCLHFDEGQETVDVYGGGTGLFPVASGGWEDTNLTGKQGTIRVGGSVNNHESPPIAVTPGDVITGTVWTWSNSGAANNTLAVQFFTSGGVLISTENLYTHPGNSTGIGSSVSVTVPGTAAWMIFGGGSSVAALTFLFYDDVCLSIAGDEAQNPYAGNSNQAARCDHTHPASEHDHDAEYAEIGHIHGGFVHEEDADWVDLTDGGETTLHTHADSAPTGYYRPLMDGYGNVVTDSGTGAAIMAYAED